MDIPPDLTGIELIEHHFPSLKGGKGYRNTSPDTVVYNCLSWALGIDWAFYSPEPLCAGYVWFYGVEREWSDKTITKIVENHGYQLSDNYDLEEGFEKLAFYYDENDVPEHFARQLPNGKWTSKLGNLNDIEHDTLESLLGSEGYHRVGKVFKRRRYTGDQAAKE